jgi:hypothetical protein
MITSIFLPWCVLIDKDDFQKYISFTKTKGRAILARAEGEMTRLDIFSDSIMLLYGGCRARLHVELSVPRPHPAVTCIFFKEKREIVDVARFLLVRDYNNQSLV